MGYASFWPTHMPRFGHGVLFWATHMPRFGHGVAVIHNPVWFPVQRVNVGLLSLPISVDALHPSNSTNVTKFLQPVINRPSCRPEMLSKCRPRWPTFKAGVVSEMAEFDVQGDR